MILESKFDIDDTIYFMKNNKLEKAKIQAIQIFTGKATVNCNQRYKFVNKVFVKYFISNSLDNFLVEQSVFDTKEEAIKQLTK